MQDDLSWGVKYLISVGITDPQRVGIMGASYGYATLVGVASTPDLYAAAVAINARNNLITLLESTPESWESERITNTECVTQSELVLHRNLNRSGRYSHIDGSTESGSFKETYWNPVICPVKKIENLNAVSKFTLFADIYTRS
jgi:hypothetical protein